MQPFMEMQLCFKTRNLVNLRQKEELCMSTHINIHLYLSRSNSMCVCERLISYTLKGGNMSQSSEVCK